MKDIFIYIFVLFALATDYAAIHHSRDIWHKSKKLKKAKYVIYQDPPSKSVDCHHMFCS